MGLQPLRLDRPEKGGNGNGKGNGADREPWPSFAYSGGALRKVKKPKGSKPPPYFWQHRDASGEWEKGTGDVDTSALLYRIEEVREAIKAGRIVLSVEGEKDVDNLYRRSFAATTSAHGAAKPNQKPKWNRKHSEQLAGADLVVLNDNDPQGRAHAEATCRCSVSVATRVRHLDIASFWPDAPEGADISDWLDRGGGTREKLEELIDAAPEHEPPAVALSVAGDKSLARPFEIVALARDAEALGWSTVVRFRRSDGAIREVLVSKAHLIEKQSERVAKRFGLVAVAGELAIEFGLLPRTKGKPTEDAKALLDQWVERRGGTGAAEPDTIVAHVRRMIEAHGEARFEAPKEIEPRPVVNRLGYREGEGSARRWMVMREAWKTEFCGGFDPAKVAQVLKERNMLEPDNDGRHDAKKVRVNGTQMRLSVLTPALFEEE
jgi:hypothetical protein